jgi:hypothetical protein
MGAAPMDEKSKTFPTRAKGEPETGWRYCIGMGERAICYWSYRACFFAFECVSSRFVMVSHLG